MQGPRVLPLGITSPMAQGARKKKILKSEWWNPIWRAPKVLMILLCKTWFLAIFRWRFNTLPVELETFGGCQIDHCSVLEKYTKNLHNGKILKSLRCWATAHFLSPKNELYANLVSHDWSLLMKMSESRPPLFFNFRGGLLSSLFSKRGALKKL